MPGTKDGNQSPGPQMTKEQPRVTVNGVEWSPIDPQAFEVGCKLLSRALGMARERRDPADVERAIEAARMAFGGLNSGTACALEFERDLAMSQALSAAMQAAAAETHRAIVERLRSSAAPEPLPTRPRELTCHDVGCRCSEPQAIETSVRDSLARFANSPLTDQMLHPSVATESPVDVPCAKCGVGQRKHKTHWATKVGPGVCSEWRAGNL